MSELKARFLPLPHIGKLQCGEFRKGSIFSVNGFSSQRKRIGKDREKEKNAENFSGKEVERLANKCVFVRKNKHCRQIRSVCDVSFCVYGIAFNFLAILTFPLVLFH